MSCIEYFVAPVFARKTSGWQSSQPCQTACFLCEKMMSGSPWIFASML